MTRSCSLTIPETMYERLWKHLFPGDGDEHGAVIAAGLSIQGSSIRLLARDLLLAKDGVDFVDGTRGYKMLKAEFIHPWIRRCRVQKLVYLAIHNHGGTYSVGFSGDDLASHERGYPALLDIAEGMPVGALVLAKHALAGDIWFPDGERAPIVETRVIGARVRRLYPEPAIISFSGKRTEHYNRQLQMFGTSGQSILSNSKVGVIGVGGVGSLLVEYLARLGVGNLVIADPDRIEITNLSRVVGASQWDALTPLQRSPWPAPVRAWAARHGRKKVLIAKRVARQANPDCLVHTIDGDFSRAVVAQEFRSCDFLFLAADSMRARLVFNALCQQYCIPGIQAGSKVVGGKDGELESAFSVTRWVTPGFGCLWCSDAISPYQLALEAKTDHERVDQDYGTKESNPSVITLNAVSASSAVNDFLFSYLEMFGESVKPSPRRFRHLDRRVIDEVLKPDRDCPECSDADTSRFARGDACSLPTSG